ncbi:MAG: hypothetical protein KME42_13750 [Tildeniella nuda ZEHNDER 1965/U140]|jgi:hypothetical protein|nr:hypothetical protein [Tildeniella nuda ZEHNDER 1965/U140]
MDFTTSNEAGSALSRYAQGDISGVSAIASLLPPAYINIDEDPISGEPRIINFLQDGGFRRFTSDRPTEPISYSLSWQSRGGKAQLLGQIKVSAGGWMISYIERNSLQNGESLEYATYQDAAAYLFQQWEQVRYERNRQAVRERNAA